MSALNNDALRVEGLHVGYPATGDVIFDVTFGLPPGQILGIIGRNGAGKTTLLRSVVGSVRNRSGAIWYGDRRLTEMSTRDIVGCGISLVPEGRHVFSTLTVRENLRLGAYGRRAGGLSDRYERVFSLFPRLEKLVKSRAGNLSGGEQQMLAIGRAMMSGPSLLMLDEPSLGLAPTVSQELYSRLAGLSSDGTTLLIVEQGLQGVLRVAGQILVLDQGRIVLRESAEDGWDNQRITQAYLGGTVPGA